MCLNTIKKSVADRLKKHVKFFRSFIVFSLLLLLLAEKMCSSHQSPQSLFCVVSCVLLFFLAEEEGRKNRLDVSPTDEECSLGVRSLDR